MSAEQIYIVHADNAEQRNLLRSVFKLHKIRFEVADKAQEREQIVPMTMEEYNAEIDCALEDYRAGRYTTHEELKKEMESWW